MEQILRFLEELRENNHKAWFDSHRKEYLQAKNAFYEIVTQLIAGIRKFDPSIGPLTIQDCTYRINRDIRFSKDKSPYKTHFGVFICPGGKKSGYSGYYFHIGSGSGPAYPDGHMVAAGNYFCEPKVVRILREDIDLGGDEFDRIVKSAHRRLYLDSSESLKKVPAGFKAGTPNDEYLKLKNFCLVGDIDRKFVTSPDLVKNLLTIFKSAQPFIAYVNRAIDYSREEI
ncbi:MAG: DUF2461 domain-containing protein [Bacteroidales bacterium]|nr:DUF2461 domain-containing protein [Bacteroidales bacterium]